MVFICGTREISAAHWLNHWLKTICSGNIHYYITLHTLLHTLLHLQAQIRQIKPLLSASSRLGRALTELFGLLVKLCVGSPVRQRARPHIQNTPTVPTPAARNVASSLGTLLANGLSWEPPATSPLPKFRCLHNIYTFKCC